MVVKISLMPKGGENMGKVLLMFAVFVGLAVEIPTALAQTGSAPGSMKLLPGYHYTRGPGLDSTTGKIWSEDGLTIFYDVGGTAGSYADCDWCGWTKGKIWRKEQIISGQSAVLVFTSSRRLVVSFPHLHANFYATIRDESDLTDMLLTVATFQAEGANATRQRPDIPRF